jgi:hypothetical protein
MRIVDIIKIIKKSGVKIISLTAASAAGNPIE